ncbi:MAG: SAF domain-containing protein, partial [Thermodesulfobacteriota bacterium]|nr:SAF domain-containing protein [Thermodesulfobacteriota bacterium]
MIKTRHFIILMACFLGVCFPTEGEPVNKKDLREVVEQGYQSIPEVKFQEIFKEYICNRLGKEESDIIVSKLKIFGNRPVPAGKISFQAFQKDKRRLEGYVRLIVIISVNGVTKKRVKLSGWVDAFESVVVTNHNIKKGTIIKKDDIYLDRKNISHLPPNVMTNMSKAIGLTAKNN